MVAPLISMMHFDSRPISRELNGRTRTATFTDDMSVSHSVITQYFWKERKTESVIYVDVGCCCCGYLNESKRLLRHGTY